MKAKQGGDIWRELQQWLEGPLPIELREQGGRSAEKADLASDLDVGLRAYGC